MNQQAIIKTRQ